MSNIEHPMSNAQVKAEAPRLLPVAVPWTLDVECSMLDILLCSQGVGGALHPRGWSLTAEPMKLMYLLRMADCAFTRTAPSTTKWTA